VEWNGWNPLSYDEALKWFELLDFGEMGQGCKQDMLLVVEGGDGFWHANHHVEGVGSQLVQSLFPLENSVCMTTILAMFFIY
jgi:hypothetical protein